MIPEVSGMVPGVSGMVSGIYGRFGRIGRLWKVPEGSGVIRTNESSPDGSIIGLATFALLDKELTKSQIRIPKGSSFVVGFG